jgi:cell wall-associated NlpC family hydrolase
LHILLHRLRPWLLGAAALTLTYLPQTASAAEVPAPIRTVVDGRLLTFDAPPIIQDDHTLVPMRGFLTALGATVTWDQDSHTATATMSDAVVKATIGSNTAYVNDQAEPLDIAPQVIADRTYIPLRFFSENLGLAVRWDGEQRTVYVDTTHRTVVSRAGSTANRTGQAMLDLARKEVGKPYAWGGTSPSTGFDCSGLVTWISNELGLGLPRTSEEMFQVGVAVKQADLQAGDLVFFSTYTDGASHVGVYDGKGGFVHAQSAETGVKVTALSTPWWADRYLGARRVTRS